MEKYQALFVLEALPEDISKFEAEFRLSCQRSVYATEDILEMAALCFAYRMTVVLVDN